MPKNDARARRWPKGHGGRWQLDCYSARGKKWPMFVVPALAGIWAENRLKAGLRTATADAGVVPRRIHP
jgi:hypothetical protein